MGKLTNEEIEQAITQTKAAREMALSQANYHAGYLKCLEDLLERNKEPEEAESDKAETPANGAVVRQLSRKAQGKTVEAGQ